MTKDKIVHNLLICYIYTINNEEIEEKKNENVL